MGQRNQYQSPCATRAPPVTRVAPVTRAPPITQAGQRDQGMGQGQGQGSQAETSDQMGQMIWYYCLQHGHMRRDCSERQRSCGTADRAY